MESAGIVTVSIVEDRPEIRHSLEMLVSGAPGFAIAGAYASMEEAFSGLESHMPDAVVIDLGLPGMSGIEGIQRVSAIRSSR